MQNSANEPLSPVSDLDQIANLLHEDWRTSRLDENGTYTPDIRATRDEQWISVHNAGQVDAANTPYSDLPGDVQSNYKTAGQIIAGFSGHDFDTPEQQAVLCNTFHEQWLARNSWAKGGNLDVPFSQLTPIKQEEILKQITIGVQFLKSKNP